MTDITTLYYYYGLHFIYTNYTSLHYTAIYIALATAIYIALTTANQSVTLQNDLNRLEKWELEWDMEFNPSKCQVICVAKRKHPIPTQ
jgi:hypothetical protein